MYKAIEIIGDYKIGDIVPDEIAVVWARMYAKSPVEKIGEKGEPEAPVDEKEEEQSEDPVEGDSSNVMLDDYLSRNQGVVMKNVADDELNEDQLKGLLDLEKKGKKRRKVINAIKLKIRGLA